MTNAVLFGGPAPEHDISILTGLLALRLSEAGRCREPQREKEQDNRRE